MTSPAAVRDDPARVSRKGQLIWTGTARQGDLIRISKSKPSAGSLTGELPARPVSVKLYAAELTPTGVNIFTSDPQENGFLYDPRRSTDVTLFESPCPENQWEGLTIVANTNISAFVLEWRVQSGQPGLLQLEPGDASRELVLEIPVKTVQSKLGRKETVQLFE